MNVKTLPEIQSIGRFSFKSPFDALLDSTIDYRVLGLLTLDDLIVEGLKPLDTIYTPAGLTQADLDDDLSNGVPIVILEDDGGHMVHVPGDRLDSIPKKDGVPYVEKMITIKLGALPTSLDLAPVKVDLSALVTDRLSVVANVEDVEISNTTYISVDDHNTKLALHNNFKSTLGSLEYRHNKLLSDYASALDEISKLKECLSNFI